MALVREIRERDNERGCHDDELTLLEGKVEELGTSLADARWDM